MKVIFVGMHNKPGKTPLDSSTKSGKLIDRIIEGIKPIEYLKTNLYNVDYYPKQNDLKIELATIWLNTIHVSKDDIIVLLGTEVHKNYLRCLGKIIEIAHPSSKRSHDAMDEYVKDAIDKIKRIVS